RRQLVTLDLAVLPPAKGCPIGNAHLVRILTQLHEASMSYLSLCINRYHHFQKLVCTLLGTAKSFTRPGAQATDRFSQRSGPLSVPDTSMMLEKRFDKLQVPQQLPCGSPWAVIPHELAVRVVGSAQPEVIPLT